MAWVSINDLSEEVKIPTFQKVCITRKVLPKQNEGEERTEVLLGLNDIPQCYYVNI